jgi:hypothetical protein
MDIDAAERFIAAHARVLDWRRFELHFGGGDAAPVVHALAAYRNPDGGFGHALEPDGRGPGSQTAALDLALRILDEVDAWDAELVSGALGWLERGAPAEGGVVFVEPPIEGWPHAPWWVPEEGRPASLAFTGSIAGTLHARSVEHAWLERAGELLWSRIGRLDGPGAYDLRGLLAFLQHVPDRDRAERALDQVAPFVLAVVELDPDAPGEVHRPLDFAPRPDSIARSLFDDETIERHLDHLAAAQHDDGGWSFNWLDWSPAATADWRGSLTVDALLLLRANGRL